MISEEQTCYNFGMQLIEYNKKRAHTFVVKLFFPTELLASAKELVENTDSGGSSSRDEDFAWVYG